jgi:hypothetical protein
MEPTQPTETAPKRFLCRHIHLTGNRCGSPSLRGEEFCYHHHATRRPSRPAMYIPPDAAFDLPAFDDRASIQFALSDLGRRIALNQLDYDRARLLLRTLRIASANLPKEPRNTEPKAILQIEEVQDDPLHGPLAPVAEVVPPPGHRSLAKELLAELRSRRPHCPTCNPTGTPPEQLAAEEAEEKERREKHQPDPYILPQIQAAAEDATKPGAPSMTVLPSWVGYRATLDRSLSPATPLKQRLHPTHRNKTTMNGAPNNGGRARLDNPPFPIKPERMGHPVWGHLIGEREGYGGSSLRSE